MNPLETKPTPLSLQNLNYSWFFFQGSPSGDLSSPLLFINLSSKITSFPPWFEGQRQLSIVYTFPRFSLFLFFLVLKSYFTNNKEFSNRILVQRWQIHLYIFIHSNHKYFNFLSFCGKGWITILPLSNGSVYSTPSSLFPIIHHSTLYLLVLSFFLCSLKHEVRSLLMYALWPASEHA